MATVAAHPDPTLEELRAALSDPDALYEIVDGRIMEVPGMSVYAGIIAQRLWDGIRAVARPSRSGFVMIETMFILDVVKNLRRRPDVAFVSAERWPLDRPVPTTGEIEVVPDLAVEVVSPNDTGARSPRRSASTSATASARSGSSCPRRARCRSTDRPSRSRSSRRGTSSAPTTSCRACSCPWTTCSPPRSIEALSPGVMG